ncbi:hypothetical protein D3C79_937110 [compost metagenome]
MFTTQFCKGYPLSLKDRPTVLVCLHGDELSVLVEKLCSVRLVFHEALLLSVTADGPITGYWSGVERLATGKNDRYAEIAYMAMGHFLLTLRIRRKYPTQSVESRLIAHGTLAL